MNTTVISGFPGVGKTYFKNHTTLNVLDSDSSLFSWTKKHIRNPDFPQNYIEHIKSHINDNVNKVDMILTSSHKDVRDHLVNEGIPFTLVYPSRELKEEYLKRYKDRSSDEEFLSLMDKNWDMFIDQCESQTGCEHRVLSSGEYL